MIVHAFSAEEVSRILSQHAMIAEEPSFMGSVDATLIWHRKAGGDLISVTVEITKRDTIFTDHNGRVTGIIKAESASP